MERLMCACIGEDERGESRLDLHMHLCTWEARVGGDGLFFFQTLALGILWLVCVVVLEEELKLLLKLQVLTLTFLDSCRILLLRNTSLMEKKTRACGEW